MSRRKGPTPSVNENEVVQMRALRVDGLTYREIGHLFGISDNTARRYVVGETQPRRLSRFDEPDDDLAYTGEWVRDGLILRPVAS